MRLRSLFPVFFMAVFLAASAAATWTFYEVYARGEALEKARKWSDARRDFARAARLRPEAGVNVKTYGLHFIPVYDPYIHMARCEIELGFYWDARAHLQLAAKAGVSPAGQMLAMSKRVQEEIKKAETAQQPPAAVVQTQAAEPQKPLAPSNPVSEKSYLEVDTTPSGARVLVDGTDRGAAPLSVPVEAGRHIVECFLDGYKSSRDEVMVMPGGKQTLPVLLTAVVPAPALGPVKAPAATIPQSSMRSTQSQSASVVESQAETRPATAQEAQPNAPAGIRQEQPRQGSRALHFLIPAMLVVIILLFVLIFRMKKGMAAASEDSFTNLIVPRMTLPTLNAGDHSPTEVLSMHQTPARNGFPIPLPEGISPDMERYRLEGILGRGGMGTTYLGSRKSDGLPAAIKIPHDHLLDNDEFKQRFVREAALGTTLHHPNIIRILETGEHHGKPYIVMELLVGETLEKRLSREGALPLQQALELARQISLALDYARLKGVVHRDLKPENIMLLRSGGLKVMDFGLARIMGSPGLTGSASFLGTPAYSAPEAAGGDEVDQQSDLYSMGIILYRMLSGELPFQSNNALELLKMHCKEPLPPFPVQLSIPPEVENLVSKLTAKSKADRFATAEAFLIDLNQILRYLVQA